MKYLALLLLVFTLLPLSQARADDWDSDVNYKGPPQWESFEAFMHERQRQDEITGLSYMLSGAAATIGGVVGYYSSDDTLSRGLYAVAQTVGVAAIGYGATDYWIGNEYNSFFHAVEGSSLTAQQKGELLQRFLEKEREEKDKARWIKIVTHSLIAAVNLYSSAHEPDRNMKNILDFLAGANVVLALSYTF